MDTLLLLFTFFLSFIYLLDFVEKTDLFAFSLNFFYSYTSSDDEDTLNNIHSREQWQSCGDITDTQPM